jgi:hypothetical protein
MQFKDEEAQRLFGVAIRVVGAVSFLRGLNDLAYVFFYVINALDVSINRSFPETDLIYGAIYFFGGIYLVRGAPVLMNFAYPRIHDVNTDSAEPVSEPVSESEDRTQSNIPVTIEDRDDVGS